MSHLIFRNTITFFLVFTFSVVFGQGLVINELMSSNTNSIVDEDGAAPDWIELHNTSPETFNLNGFGLSDDTIQANRWLFPSVEIQPDSFILVFASGKNRNTIPLMWETVIDQGDTWRYLLPSEEPSSLWKNASFDDSSWHEGISGFGYGDNDDSTLIAEGTISIFIRKTFDIASLSAIKDVKLHMDYDDAFVAYINGKEVARDNITTVGPPPFDQKANAGSGHEAKLYKGQQPDVFNLGALEDILVEGQNIIAIQVHNLNNTSSDMTVIPFLSFGKTAGENGSISNHLDSANFQSTRLHTDFKISSKGETLYLTGPEGEHIDSIFTNELKANISYGRKPETDNDWGLFDEPTPGKSNTTQAYSSYANEVIFSTPSGIYDGPVTLTLSTNTPSDPIYYTLDANDPGTKSTLYTNAISISKNTIVKAVVIKPGSIKGDINTQGYFFNIDHGSLPVVSIVTEPDNLWDYNTGIYVKGPNANNSNPHFGANFWQDWEKPAHIQLIEPDGKTGFSRAIGLKIFGAWSRAKNQKSLAVFFRKSFGEGKLKYQLFPDHPSDEFNSLVLRNSGNDWNRTMFRDACITSLFHEDVDKQAYRPAVLYLNGVYYGIQNIREKVNEDFIATHHEVKASDVSMLEKNAVIVEGDNQHYLNMIKYIEDNDLSKKEHYDYVSARMDISNYMRYMIGNIYVNNNDWPGNNIKFWRPQTEDGKWRWITYDTDFGLGWSGSSRVFDNTIRHARIGKDGSHRNPKWATFLFSNLLKNTSFRNAFITEMADQINSNFSSENVNNQIDLFKNRIIHEIDDHMLRWGESMNRFNSSLNVMKDFANRRPAIIRGHIRSEFNLSGQYSMSINKVGAGSININSLKPTNYPWTGVYFTGVPVVLTALPASGYEFVKWQGAINATQKTISVNASKATSITAIFKEKEAISNNVIVNEINYSSSKDFDTGDWIELSNKSNQKIDLSFWRITDDNESNAFIFPEDAMIEADGFLVLVRDLKKFNTFNPDISNVLGEVTFGLSGSGDCIRLYDKNDALVNEVCYTSSSPWPSEPNGSGHTLAYTFTEMNNSLADAWTAHPDLGTPGSTNNAIVVSPPLSATVKYENFDMPYPNPFSNSLSVDNHSLEMLSIFLSDMQGSKIINIESEESMIKINTSQLNNGMYILRVRKKGITKTFKILRQTN